MAFSRHPGEVKNFKMKAAEGLTYEGLILAINNDTASDPRVTKVTASGDTVFGIGYNDTYDQEDTENTAGQVSLIQDGEAMVAVIAATYQVGQKIYVSHDTTLTTYPGFGDNASKGTIVGECQEYKVVSSANVTAKTNQIRTRLTFRQS